ncbi:hypothetical protein LTS18_005208 [Coniosporium uncinatum]|uniref:Uncharacterized protein n=1 Tax=Coniosporium uncinatum TaxID=93489 RepID=A0ACC3DRC6_9PEZI|nr:hypothetical protein LTS18_005208 [Coniosporium uncinatum]
MHRGGAMGGHYWIYIRDFKSGVWRKYNDEQVTEVKNLDEIFKQDTSKPTANLVVYVQDDIKLDLTEAVDRAPVVPEIQMQDVEDTANPIVTTGIDPNAGQGDEDEGPVYIEDVLEGVDPDGDNDDGHLDLCRVTICESEGE